MAVTVDYYKELELDRSWDEKTIREKLKENTKNPKFIKTVWGVGYKIEK